MFTYALSIFLTSTAFVPTNAKYGIPLSRYTVFFENCPLGDAPIVRVFVAFIEKELTPCIYQGLSALFCSNFEKRIAFQNIELLYQNRIKIL